MIINHKEGSTEDIWAVLRMGMGKKGGEGTKVRSRRIRKETN